MKVKLAILANSIRPGGRCVAGVDLDTGQWVRPVAYHPNRAVSNPALISRLKLLEIYEVPLADEKPTPPDHYQIENVFVDSWKWTRLGVLAPAEVAFLCEDDRAILHSASDRVEPRYLESLAPAKWKSLQLVKTVATFAPDEREADEWRVHFKDGSGNPLALKLTDPVAVERLAKKHEIGRDCYLTISLTAPWTPPDGGLAPRCYKLVAAAIERGSASA